jgi:hypothetical protein
LHFEAYTATAGLARGTFVDELYTGAIERIDQFHKGIDISSDESLAGLHALNRWNR